MNKPPKFAMLSFAAAAAMLLCGCMAHNVDWIQFGPKFPAKKISEIEVYRSRAEVKRPWEPVALIKGAYVPYGDERSLQIQEQKAKAEAASWGADAIVLRYDDNMEEISVNPSRQGEQPVSYVAGIAIRYIRRTQGEDPGDIENWRKTNKGW